MDGIREYSKSISDEDILKDAYGLWTEINDYENDVRAKMVDDLKFANGDQWNAKHKKSREGDSKPALTVSRINQFLNKVKNEQRQNKPSIKVVAGDDPMAASSETERVKQAEIRQGMIRKIQYESNAVDAYQKAYDDAVECGRGFFRIRADYESDKTFQQKLIIDYIRNPLNVYMDTSHKLLDYSDAKHGFILERIKTDKFKNMYPDADPIHFAEIHNDINWLNSDEVTVAEFYCTWAKKRELWKLADGSTIYADEIDEVYKDVKPEEKRTILEPYIMWYKMTKLQILDRKHIPGRWIPIIPVIGVERDVDGKLEIKGMIRDATDIQRMYNYWVSVEAEQLQTSVKSEYIVADGQIKGYEHIWRNANRTNYAYLPYKPTSLGDHLVPPPTRQFPKQPDAAIIQAKMACIDDMKAVFGIYDPGLGAPANETSGRAILARQRQSDTANYHYIEGERIAITHGGRIINSWLTTYYPAGRKVTLVEKEDKERTVELGAMENGEQIDIGDSEFDVVVTMGPSFQTKRQEAVEKLMEMVQAMPQIAQLMSDILVKNIDAPYSEEISERLRKTIPPEYLEQKGGEEQMRQTLAQAMQQVKQDQQAIQMLTAQLQEVSQELETKGMENKTRVQVAQINAQASIAVANIKALADRESDARHSREAFFKAVQPPARAQTESR